MTFWNVFSGVLAGIVAGVAINIIINWVTIKNINKDWRNNLKFEINYNIKKLESFIEEVVKYRNKVNGDSLDSYFGYFPLSKVLISTSNQIFNNGLVYRFLKDDDIKQLQDFLSEFNLYGENYINNQIKYNKELFKNIDLRSEIKRKIISDIDFWEEKFKAYKKFLIELIKKI